MRGPSMRCRPSSCSTAVCSRGCATRAATGSNWCSTPTSPAPFLMSTPSTSTGTRSCAGGKTASPSGRREGGTAVKFGFMVPRESDFGDGDDPYGRIYDMCQMAEDLGFDFGTFTHHRFSPERPFLSSPFIMMSAVAARTTSLKLATTVLVLPLYHPLDVAEAVASLDHVSG